MWFDDPRHWGIIDFAESNNGQPTINDWIENGYPDEVYWDPHSVTSCPIGEQHCYDGNPGSINNSYATSLNVLKDSGIYFTLPIFNYAEDTGPTHSFTWRL